LFSLLSLNLRRNQRELRLQSLRALANKFEFSDQGEVMRLMLGFEELRVAFETEKGKILQIERIKA
jgi:hypothetical protein